MMPSRLPRVHLVTAPPGSGGEAGGLVAAVEAAVRGLPPGSVAVHLRAKEAGGRELLALARALRQLLHPAGQLLLVNDRIDVARASGAAGVHLPSRGVPPAEARRLLGPGALLGVSCHGAADVRRAREGRADFATFGPVFDTPSKRGLGLPVGLDALREAAGLGLPLLGLGGVDPGNAPAVVAAGAWGVAAIRAWLEAADPGVAVRELLQAVGEERRAGPARGR